MRITNTLRRTSLSLVIFESICLEISFSFVMIFIAFVSSFAVRARAVTRTSKRAVIRTDVVDLSMKQGRKENRFVGKFVGPQSELKDVNLSLPLFSLREERAMYSR